MYKFALSSLNCSKSYKTKPFGGLFPFCRRKSTNRLCTSVSIMGVQTGGRGKSKTKCVSASKKAGLTFPVGRTLKLMRNRMVSKRYSKGCAVYMAAALEYIAAEVLELSGNACRDNHKKRITPRHVMLAVRNDDELNFLLSNVTLAGGGVLPDIHTSLLKKRKKSPATTVETVATPEQEQVVEEAPAKPVEHPKNAPGLVTPDRPIGSRKVPSAPVRASKASKRHKPGKAPVVDEDDEDASLAMGE